MKPLLFIAILSLFGKPSSEIRIPYRQLTWADYRGAIPENEPTIAARTYTQLDMGTTQSGDVYHFQVVAYVLADSSFVRLRDDKTLRHEQTHFKIAYIEARRCMLALQPLQGGDSVSEKAAGILYDHFFDVTVDLEDQFDRETNHSLDELAEKSWEDRISRELHNFETPASKKHGGNR